MSKFRLEDILNVTFANTQYMKDKRIYDTFGELKKSMYQADEADEAEKQMKQQGYLKAYINVMEKVSRQLSETKNRYLNLDKKELKNSKCQQLAKSINFFREQSYLYQNKVKKSQESLKHHKIQHSILIQQKQALLQQLQRQKTVLQTQRRYRKSSNILRQSEASIFHRDPPKKVSHPTNSEIKKLEIPDHADKANNSDKNEEYHKFDREKLNRPKTARYLKKQNNKQFNTLTNLSSFRVFNLP